MSKNNIIKARTCVYNVNYHIVWCTKYRKKILAPEITNELKQLLNDIAEEKGFIIQECEVGNDDHVHLFVSAHPKIAPSYIVKMLKGISGRKLFLSHPEISKNLWKSELWNNSYYIETIGSISDEVIKKYIERQ
ncbi:MAG: IS200/IS605 family transposase [Candidatus Gastranaerophilaceae bacterium]